MSSAALAPPHAPSDGHGAKPHAPAAAAPAGVGSRASLGPPAWLAPARFESVDFSPDDTVAELRRYVPLPTVKAELQAYSLQLRGKLVEALNEDYGDFVGLSGRLSGLEGAVVRMRQPLLDIQGRLAGVQAAVEDELNALQQGLQRRQDAAAARATLELMQEAHTSTGKVEKLLEEVAQQRQAQQQQQQQQQGEGAAAAAEALEGHCRLLERGAGEAARLLYLLDRGKHLAFVKSLERRVAGCRLSLDRQLQAALLESLRAQAWGPAMHCLRGYLELGEPGRAEEGLRSGLVGPLVRAVVAEVRQQQLSGGANGGGGAAAPSAPGGANALSLVADAALSRLHEAAAPLLAELTAAGSGLAALDLLGAVLLAELSLGVADGMPGIFSPGNPVSFRAGYAAGQELLARLEAMAGSRAALERLRGSAAWAGWAKRWNLPVYFSLVFQDIAGTFEAAAKGRQLARASDGGAAAAAHGGRPLQLAVTSCLWSCLQKAVSPGVFVPQLSDKFAKLVLQLLRRYDTWLGDAASRHKEAAAAAAAGGGAEPAAPATAAVPVAAAAVAGGAAPPPAAAQPPAAAARLSADECAVVCADADALQELLVGPFAQQLRTLLDGLPGDAVPRLLGLVEQQAARIARHGQQVLLLLGEGVIERCTAVVRQIKGILATYRMTAKGPPVRHSHYVAGVLQPLRQLLDAPGPVQALPAPLKLLLSREVVDAVNGAYRGLAEELLTQVKKTESSLKRLKKTRPGEPDGDAAAAAAATMSDSDKICLQLFLDVQEHGRQVAKFGLAAEELSSFRELLAAVTPAQQQQQQQQAAVS